MNPNKTEVGNILRDAQSGTEAAGEAGTPPVDSDREARTENSKISTRSEDWTDSNAEQESQPDNRSPVDQISDLLAENNNVPGISPEPDAELNPAEATAGMSNEQDIAELESMGAPQVPVTQEQEAAAYQNDINIAKQNLYQAINDPALAQLRIDDPGQAAARMQQIQNYSGQIQAAERYVQHSMQQNQMNNLKAYQGEQRKESDRLIPAWKNREVMKRQGAAITKHLQSLGYSNQQINVISATDVAKIQKQLFPQKVPKKLAPARTQKAVKPKPLKLHGNSEKAAAIGDILRDRRVQTR